MGSVEDILRRLWGREAFDVVLDEDRRGSAGPCRRCPLGSAGCPVGRSGNRPIGPAEAARLLAGPWRAVKEPVTGATGIVCGARPRRVPSEGPA